MCIKQDFEKMSAYEKWKLRVDFLRFIATMLAPFMIILFGHLAKVYLGW
jgi:hypothetical protein